ncbi:Bacteroides conjugative transposon TraJ protein [Hydrobacter penzbergensis]|uniref:Bacteroides conjugative transposon TraJ protein n=1 Tax=Hydrobacter penzbergensis TaxID=1235997 RepID=A0A8X8I8P5_9BACT|nr:conjugative transposon protein TraJ [Hydrobacter penzbergensis]SDW13740.1 Bacteroides conjugative transposon TraJ protein [Hydrobacter penzbergensis]
MTKWIRAALIAAVGMVLPQLSHAQGVADEIHGLQSVLDQLYDEMLPLCSKLIGVGQGIAGFAATWYIASRVWRHIANAEPIDFYPLFRPFVIGFAVMIFPSVLGMINGVMKPTVTATASMVTDSDKAIAELLKQKEEAIKTTKAWQMYVGETGSGDREKWYKYTHPDDPTGANEGIFEGIGNDIKFAMSKASYNFRNSIKEWMSEVLRVLFEAAALCINTLRTFQLIVLAILGPLVFGIAVFDGFQHTLTVWLARYINIFLWLPVANIFGAIIGKIQEKMLKVDLSQIQSNGDTFFSSTDAAYLIFLIIGIVGYFTVPSVANYIVNAGGGGAMVQKVTSLFSTTSRTAVNTMSGSAGMVADAMGNAAGRISSSMSSYGMNSGYFNESGSTGNSSYMQDKISGKSST